MPAWPAVAPRRRPRQLALRRDLPEREVRRPPLAQPVVLGRARVAADVYILLPFGLQLAVRVPLPELGSVKAERDRVENEYEEEGDKKPNKTGRGRGDVERDR